MNELTKPAIPSMSPLALSLVQAFEELSLQHAAQVKLVHEHFIHAGMYARTATYPAGLAITGALIKLQTILVISGHVKVFTGDDIKEFIGYHVIPAEKNRKQLFLTKRATKITMFFPTSANNVKDAEKEFTDEWARLTTNQEA